MIKKTLKKTKLFARYSAILLMVFVFGFSDFLSLLPITTTDNKLSDNFKVNIARAAAPTYVGSGNVGTGTGVIIPTLPGGIQTNDILLLLIETANQTTTISNPNGGTWIEILNSPQGTGTAGGTTSTRLTIFWSRYNGTQGNPTASDSGDHQRGRIFAFRGVIETGNPWDVTYGNTQTTASASVSIPGGTTTVNETLVLAIVSNGTDTNAAQCGNTWTNSSLTGLVEQSGDNNNSGNGGGFCIATGTKTAAGVFNATTTSINTSSTQGLISIALKPIQDTSAPTPNPMAFSIAPNNSGFFQIDMTSTTGSDTTTPINYLFTNNNSLCGANAGTGGTSSSWQSGTSYSDLGLQPNKCYGYTVTARDSVTPTPNTGTASAISSIYTSANIPGTPVLSGATSSTLNLTNAENSNPTSNPTTYFAVQITTTNPNDAAWLNQWADSSGNPSASAVWMTDTELDALILQGLQADTTYGVKIKARNQDGDETVLSTEGQGTTSAQPGPDASSVSYQVGGDGARSGYSATISGNNFGNISAGSRANCIGGSGTGCVRFIVGGNATVLDADVTAWTNTSISFTINANLASYGGLASLQVVRAGLSDNTPLNFYVYPTIFSLSANNGKIGDAITVSGDHFGTSAGSVTVINNSATVAGGWNETSLTVRIPGQQGAAATTGKLQLSRSDSRTSNQYPSAGNFTVDPPLITSSSSSPVTNGQSGVVIHFNGSGVDTDTTPTAVRPTFYLKKSGETSIPGDNTGSNYGITTAYQDVYATFDLTGAVAGSWDLELTNMDGQVSTCIGCLVINANGPSVTGITPGSGFDFEILSGLSVNGSNFDANPTVKLTKAGEVDILPSTPFTRASAILLTGGAFDLSGKATGTWNVIVTNSDSKSGSYSGLLINSAIANMYQFADNTDLAQPPTSEIIEGEGIGNQPDVYFRLDMDSNESSGEMLIPEIEIQSIGTSFQCVTLNCPEKTTGFFAQVSLPYSGTTLRDWLNISGITGADDGDYHWRVRLTNAAGKIGGWIEFGTDPQATNIDFYLDNTPPLIAGECPASNITDSKATIDWNTSDAKSGAQTPPGSGDYATAQIEYKISSAGEAWAVPGSLFPATPKPREASPHTVTIIGLTSGSDYVFRARSKDYFGNEVFSTNCTFTTSAAMPIKTIELFIAQEENAVTETGKLYNLAVAIPESPDNPVSLKSAMIEINGISGASASDQTINVGFLRGNQAIAPLGDDFTIESSASGPTPFMILFDALGASGNGQENMQDLVASGPLNSKEYTLFLKGTATPTYALNAKLILTYTYTP